MLEPFTHSNQSGRGTEGTGSPARLTQAVLCGTGAQVPLNHTELPSGRCQPLLPEPAPGRAPRLLQ